VAAEHGEHLRIPQTAPEHIGSDMRLDEHAAVIALNKDDREPFGDEIAPAQASIPARLRGSEPTPEQDDLAA
jgi:hypothetical protein